MGTAKAGAIERVVHAIVTPNRSQDTMFDIVQQYCFAFNRQ
jgi:hypothetical protein